MKTISEYKIYKAQNIVTGQVYIGATTKDLDERKADHLQKASKGTGGYFQEAISTYGADVFDWEQIDTANSFSELAQKEKKYILIYDSLEKGYNRDSGGGFKKTIFQYSIEDGKLINSYHSLESAANAVNASRKSISNTCSGQNKTCKGYYWSYTLSEPFISRNDLRKKKVIQSDLLGSQIAVFESVSEASRQTGVSKTCISRCCRGERKSSRGYAWRYD